MLFSMMNFFSRNILLKLILVGLALISAPLFSAGSADQSLQEYIMAHIQDAKYWSPLPFHLADVRLEGVSELDLGPLSFTDSLHALMLVLGALFMFLVFGVFYKKTPNHAPKGFTNLLEALVMFVRNDICINYLGEKDGKKLAPIFMNFFFFILFLNIMGLIPLFTTATANINVTVGFALITFSLMFALGVLRNGPLGFVKLFIPSGVPFPVLIILFPIEVVGFLIKPVALSIRLFANMFAGHLVIFSIIGLVITFGLAGLPSLLLALFIYVLEILVAFIQAYIFTMLSAMFVGEVLHPHH